MNDRGLGADVYYEDFLYDLNALKNILVILTSAQPTDAAHTYGKYE